jgi:hypothetical protein
MRTGRDHVLLAILFWGLPITVVTLIVAMARIRNLLFG